MRHSTVRFLTTYDCEVAAVNLSILVSRGDAGVLIVRHYWCVPACSQAGQLATWDIGVRVRRFGVDGQTRGVVVPVLQAFFAECLCCNQHHGDPWSWEQFHKHRSLQYDVLLVELSFIYSWILNPSPIVIQSSPNDHISPRIHILDQAFYFISIQTDIHNPNGLALSASKFINIFHTSKYWTRQSFIIIIVINNDPYSIISSVSDHNIYA